MRRGLLIMGGLLLLAAQPAIAQTHRVKRNAVRLLSSHAAMPAPPRASLVLINPDGSPVGGRLQAWADASQMPTFRGRVVVDTPAAMCGNPVAGCAVGPPFYGDAYKIAASDRESLYFEMGHLFDWRYLTNADRRWLAGQWREPRIPWLDTDLGLRQASEDGLEGAFAAIYGVCAADRHADIAGIGLDVGMPTATVVPAMAQPRDGRSTCAFIMKVAGR